MRHARIPHPPRSPEGDGRPQLRLAAATPLNPSPPSPPPVEVVGRSPGDSSGGLPLPASWSRADGALQAYLGPARPAGA
jgi:hypothetical protein